jgi:threonine aldolase
MKFIDLRSDTVTIPTEEMKKVMFNAEVGDDVYDDDPTIRALELKAAELLNKEDALFVPSGTFGNQLALFTHCKRGQEVILGDDCHIVVHETGASSIIAGVQLRTINSIKGELNPSEIENKIRKEIDIHFPETGLICLENAHSNGRVIKLQNMKEIYDIASKYNIPIHLDGARIFNAAAHLNVEAKEISKYADSISFCLSKGLCAPVGSVLVGKKEFIKKAKKNRKIMGGALRQAGFLAAAGIYALDNMIDRMNEDHKNAQYLADELEKIECIKVNKEDLHINLVFFKINKNISPDFFVDSFLKEGIKVNPPENNEYRLVTHYWVSKENIDKVVTCLKKIISSL